ncbi:MAG: helix-turn-helix transcriptional regulator [Clostridiales bacterium]|nr:helix-turn-helix transcriptional regulator [Clostridiales bacterium]
MVDLKPIIAKNIIVLRKSMNWTQAELAQKLNYSDKAISKWERAESIPDVMVLKEIADLFQVKVDYLLEEEHADERGLQAQTARRRNRLVIALLAASLVLLIATILFVFLQLYSMRYSVRLDLPSWIVYVYAVPVSCIVLLVFNAIWGHRNINFAIISVLVWSCLLSVYLSFLSEGIWIIFLIGIPSQIIILLWASFRKRSGCNARNP